MFFFGTPEYVIPVVDKIYKTYGKGKEGLILVVTQSPKPTGREKRMTYSPVDQWAFEKRIPKTFSLDDVPEADLGICAAYGKIIPESVINKFKYGILNIHPSLLPKYRGASPVSAAIAAGETQTGLTVIMMDKKMDHGPIISQFREQVQVQDTTETLRKRLFERSAQFLIDLIPNYLSGKVKPKEQDHKKATFTKILTKEDGFIDLTISHSPLEISNFIRAMHPWPGAWTQLRSSSFAGQAKRLKLLPNDMVQLEGKNPTTLKQFESAYGSLSSLVS